MNRIERLVKQMSDCDGFYITGRANIFYYSGFTSEDASLLITRSNTFIITDSRYTVQAREQSPDFELYDISGGLNGLFAKINLKRLGYEENYITVSAFEKLKKSAPGIEFFPAGAKISEPRRIKEPAEIEIIRQAEQLGDAAFSHVLNILRAGITEKAVAFELETFMRKNGASGLSFETIVASGIRSAMPHGTASDKIIENGDFVTMDFGCILDGYCSDMTRTVIIKHADSRQREIYSVVLSAQKAALEFIKDGILLKDADAAARKVIENAGYGKFFTHSLGHSVGIEIHESPNFSPKSTGTASCGNVITVEPGIYIDGFGGVRIEDIVAITPNFAENLTKSEKELIII